MSIVKGSISTLEEQGKQFAKNKAFHDIAQFMEHPLCREFYENYLKSSSTREAMLLYLALYKEIDTNTDDTFNAYHKLGVMKELTSTVDRRHTLCNMYTQRQLE
jgi:hypothetical protein